MSAKLPSKDIYNIYSMLEFDLSDVVISFKELLSYIGAKDVYSGKESIPFRDKDLNFQEIMLSEFIT